MKPIDMLHEIGSVDDKFVLEADTEISLKKKPTPLQRILIPVAACLALVLVALFALPMLSNNDNGSDHAVTENEPAIHVSLQEIQEHQTFGPLFPTKIIDGYKLESDIGLYNETVVRATFVNEYVNDVLTITIAPKEYFQDVQLDVVLYQDTVGEGGSVFYVYANEHIICYNFSRSDIAYIEGFNDMVFSSSIFR